MRTLVALLVFVSFASASAAPAGERADDLAGSTVDAGEAKTVKGSKSNSDNRTAGGQGDSGTRTVKGSKSNSDNRAAGGKGESGTRKVKGSKSNTSE